MRFLASLRRSTAIKTAPSRDQTSPVEHRSSMRGQYHSLSFAMLTVATFLPGCATVPAVQGNRLSSYEGLTPSDGKLTKSKLMVRKEQVLAAKTINIAPTVYPS